MRKLALALLSVFMISGAVLAATITPDLTEKLNSSAPDELIPVMVIMAQQADQEQMQFLTEGLDKRATREAVLGYLKSMAESTQGDIRVYLESLKSSGKVSHVYPLFIANIISLKATPEVIHRLEGFAGIENICYDPESYALAGEPVGPLAPPGIDEADEITWGLTDIHAPEVWALGYNGTGVIVGMIDTGVNYNHLDLTDHMWNGGPQYPNHGWNFYNNNSTTMDGHSHGTHTAGTVASDGSAGTQAGVAPNATIMILKVLGDNGQGSPAQCIAGMNFAMEHGADLFSMSLGWYGSLITPPEIPPFRIACENLLAAGVPGAVCAGNEAQYGSYPIPNNVRTPGRCPPPWLHPGQTLIGGLSCVICIGATQESHAIASFSSRGPSTWATYAPWYDYAYNPGMGLLRPDVSAPGVNTKSCSNTNIAGYSFMQGTSMATPHVAGTMALMLQKNSSLTPRQIDSLLEVTALDLGTAGKDNIFGSGLINALNAVNATPAGVPPTPVVTLTPINPPIVVPAQGGSFQFDASVVNNGPSQSPFSVWARIKYPNGTYTAPTLGPVTVNPPVGVSLTRLRTQNIPSTYPAGSYVYLGYANSTYAYPALDSASFTFTKSAAADGGPIVSNSQCFGEPFPGEQPMAASIPSGMNLVATPNPFNPATTIRYQLSAISQVSLKVYDLNGRLAATLVEGIQEAGAHRITFDGSKHASGIYFCRLCNGQNSTTQKLMLLK
jgi:serine protease AprX